MIYNNDLIAGKLRRWGRYLDNYRLPEWENIPDLGLYMEQVIQLLIEYLDYLPPELKDSELITASAINNYVRTGVMPKPVNKKYYRLHIAYLIVICSLKHNLNISFIQKIIPLNISEEQAREIYDAYAKRHRIVSLYFVEQIRLMAGPLLGLESSSDYEAGVQTTEDLITSAIVFSGFSKLLAEKLILLEGRDLSDGGSIDT
ncbi:MAG: DUF1836 domain-containing protein [Lachnospiraceae bacterium]|jgi:hypothetical protein